MWSTAFTSSRSHFVETARVGIQAEPPSQARSKASEAAVAEALRLALGDNSKFRLILVDRGAEGSVRTVLRPEEIVVDEDSPLAPKDPPPPRSELVVVARLGGDCHRTSDACVVQTRRILDGLGVAKLDGLCVPWPAALGDGGNDPYHVSADVKRQKRLFLRTWKNLQPLVEAGSVRWLGTEMLETWQLERLIEAVAPEQRPAFNGAAKESDVPNFKGSDLGQFPLVSAHSWTSDHLSERSRRVDAFFGTRARGTLTSKRR